ncbi:MAG TPA: AMP-binding protein [Candidatus Acidoferrales bacterium]|nr:AMP-binding protein [Candidatus Acidoferrales bacterium]
MRRASLADSIAELRRHGRQTALIQHRGYRRIRWSYAELAGAAAQFARELQSRGVGKGEHVLLWGDDCAEWIAAFLGCILRGAVVVPMDHGAAPEFAARVAAAVDPRLVVAGRHQATAGLAGPRLVLEDLPGTLAAHSTESLSCVSLDRDDPLEIVFTSGTTAEPRGVVISHGNFLANLEPLETEICKYLGYERWVHPLRFLNLLPLSHVFGQFMGIFVPPLLGGVVVLLDTLNPSEVQRAIRRDRVSVLVTVPRLIEGLADKIQRDLEAAGRLERFRRDFAAAENEHFLRRWWRFRRIRRRFGWKFWAFISGGASLPEAIEQFWSRLGYAIIQGYGLTETASVVSVQHPFQPARGSIGKVLPGSEIKLSETGEILVRGENVAVGYWPARGRASLEPVAGDEGWFHTGDIGALDAAGNLFFKGRRKNVIVTAAGMNIYPEDLEAALRRRPEVRDAVVIGLDRDGNAEPCAVLLLREPGAAAAETAVSAANEQLADYQRIRRWYVWLEDDFPRTPTRKPQLHAIETAVRAAVGAPSSAPPAGGLADLVARVTGRPVERLTAGAHLARDLQLSSIERVELLAALEDRYQVELNETQFAEAATLDELERIVREPAARRSEYVYPRWAQRWPVTWIRFLVYYLLAWPATLALGYPRIRGRELLAGVGGPVLVVSNHVSSIDIGFILAALPARFRRLAVAMEGERLEAMRKVPGHRNRVVRLFWRVVYGLVVALFNVFPLPQLSGFRESFAYAGQSVDRGYNLLVFPEGARTRDGRIQPFRAGIGLLAAGLNLPVVAVRIDGLFELKQAHRWFTRPGRIGVRLGAPVRYHPGTGAEEIAEDLQRRVASL